MNDKVQPVSVETPGCPGATCKLSNADGNYFINKTPGTVMVNKAYGDLTVECSKDGEKSTNFIKSSANASMFGNIIFGGVILRENSWLYADKNGWLVSKEPLEVNWIYKLVFFNPNIVKPIPKLSSIRGIIEIISSF